MLSDDNATIAPCRPVDDDPDGCGTCARRHTVADRLVYAIGIHRRVRAEAAAAGLTDGDLFYESGVLMAWHAVTELEAELAKLAKHTHLPINVVDLTARRARRQR